MSQTPPSKTPLLDTVVYPSDLKKLDKAQLRQFSDDRENERIHLESESLKGFTQSVRNEVTVSCRVAPRITNSDSPRIPSTL